MNDGFLWWRDGLIYQIYPRSFIDTNGDGIGDLKGIIEKLDYLKWLGVDGIWLSPINPSPDVDFGYDVTEYQDIDPKFGSMQDFELLLKIASSMGIHIIMDLVLNHTSDQHPWFKAAKSSRDNPFHDYYIWQNTKVRGKKPNNWQSIFGGSGWEFIPEIGQSYYHMFYKQQPDLNWRNPNVQKAMLDVFRFWLGKGVDGFRLDVFNLYFKDSCFHNNPPQFGLRGFDRQKHLYDVDQPEMLPLIKEIRKIMDSRPGTYVIGETFMSTPKKAAHYCGPDLLHAAFNFEFLQSRWNAGSFFRKIMDWEKALSPETWPNYVLSNHDVPRIAQRYARGEGDIRLKLAATMLLTLRGTPYVYYGDEIGMRDLHITHSEIMDPIGKKFWPFHSGRDGCRGPMQWSGEAQAGFTTGKPWIKVHPDYLSRNVLLFEKDDKSILWFYKKLIEIKKTESAIRVGMFLPINVDPSSLLAYLRKTDDETILVALNFRKRPIKLFLGRELATSNWKLLLSNRREVLDRSKPNYIELLGEEAIILKM